MKQRKIEIDVDFIGGQGTLTVEEEKSLIYYFKQRKLTSQKPQNKIPAMTVKHGKTIV
jgi:hypothetical protein